MRGGVENLTLKLSQLLTKLKLKLKLSLAKGGRGTGIRKEYDERSIGHYAIVSQPPNVTDCYITSRAKIIPLYPWSIGE